MCGLIQLVLVDVVPASHWHAGDAAGALALSALIKKVPIMGLTQPNIRARLPHNHLIQVPFARELLL